MYVAKVCKYLGISIYSKGKFESGVWVSGMTISLSLGDSALFIEDNSGASLSLYDVDNTGLYKRVMARTLENSEDFRRRVVDGKSSKKIIYKLSSTTVCISIQWKELTLMPLVSLWHWLCPLLCFHHQKWFRCPPPPPHLSRFPRQEGSDVWLWKEEIIIFYFALFVLTSLEKTN